MLFKCDKADNSTVYVLISAACDCIENSLFLLVSSRICIFRRIFLQNLRVTNVFFQTIMFMICLSATVKYYFISFNRPCCNSSHHIISIIHSFIINKHCTYSYVSFQQYQQLSHVCIQTSSGPYDRLRLGYTQKD